MSLAAVMTCCLSSRVCPCFVGTTCCWFFPNWALNKGEGLNQACGFRPTCSLLRELLAGHACWWALGILAWIPAHYFLGQHGIPLTHFYWLHFFSLIIYICLLLCHGPSLLCVTLDGFVCTPYFKRQQCGLEAVLEWLVSWWKWKLLKWGHALLFCQRGWTEQAPRHAPFLHNWGGFSRTTSSNWNWFCHAQLLAVTNRVVVVLSLILCYDNLASHWSWH